MNSIWKRPLKKQAVTVLIMLGGIALAGCNGANVPSPQSVPSLSTPTPLGITGVTGAQQMGSYGASQDEIKSDLPRSPLMELNLPGDSLFPVGSFTVLSTEYPVLSRFASFIEQYDSTASLTLIGHTDCSQGDNQTLSVERAKAVSAILIQDGIPANKVSAQGVGSTQPLVPNSCPAYSASHDAPNRRVEILVKG